MKFSQTSLSLLLIISPTLFACSDDARNQVSAVANDVEDSWDAIKAYTIERSAEFRASVSEGMRDLDDQLARASDRSGEAWEATRADLAAKRAALAVQLQALGDATADTWAAARDKTAELYEDLRAATQRALDQREE
jgi:hypothetical protein